MATVPLEVRAQIEDLLTQFAYCVDNGDAEGVAALFTQDGVIEAPNFTVTGPAEIAERYGDPKRRAARLSKHGWSNLRFVSVSEDRLEIQAYALTIVGAKPAPAKGGQMASGVTTDTVVRQGDAWLFARRKLEVHIEGAIAAAAGH